MALTLEAEQRLMRVDLVKFYEDNSTDWDERAKRSYDFCKENFPRNSTIRPDDVAKALVPILEIDEDFINYLSINKLKQKYWISDFCDLIIDRCWDKISNR